MTLLLTIEQGPRPQAVRQKKLEGGELVIGRGSDAGWQIDDPDMFVSRAHCRINRRPEGYVVTDMSSSGLYIDDAGPPLGQGNSVLLQDGMRLRLGDYVVGVDLESETSSWNAKAGASPAATPDHSPPPAAPSGLSGQNSVGSDDFFSAKSEEEPRAPRPANLPDPFEKPVPGAFSRASEPLSQAFDDPFSLDPVSDKSGSEAPPASAGSAADPFDFSDFAASGPKEEAPPSPAPTDDFDFGPSGDPESRGSTPPPTASEPQDEMPAAGARSRQAAPPVQDREPPPAAPATPGSARVEQTPLKRQTSPSDAELRAALLRGMGMSDEDMPHADPIAEMEKLGREYRLMMEGLMLLLRKRAEEKGNARVAQTVVGVSEVNPLKFLPTVDDALAMVLAGRSAGFLNGEAAIQDSIRDLAHHHVRAWRGVQAALRRMIDRFDPAALEAELKGGSSMSGLLPGSRNAKLWELYCKRHKEIAQSVESRFLGEVGADFRDAYEEG